MKMQVNAHRSEQSDWVIKNLTLSLQGKERNDLVSRRTWLKEEQNKTQKGTPGCTLSIKKEKVNTGDHVYLSIYLHTAFIVFIYL